MLDLQAELLVRFPAYAPPQAAKRVSDATARPIVPPESVDWSGGDDDDDEASDTDEEKKAEQLKNLRWTCQALAAQHISPAEKDEEA